MHGFEKHRAGSVSALHIGHSVYLPDFIVIINMRFILWRSDV